MSPQKDQTKKPNTNLTQGAPEVVPVLETHKGVIFPSSSIPIRIEKDQDTEYFLVCLKERPYCILQTDAEDGADGGFPVGVLGVVTNLDETDPKYFVFRFSGIYRVYVERVEKQHGVIMAKHKPVIDIPLSEEDADEQNVRRVVSLLQDEFPLAFSLLMHRVFGTQSAQAFFQKTLVQDVMVRLRNIDARNMSSVIDGVMNMLNHVVIVINGKEVGIHKASLIILAEPAVLLRLKYFMDLLNILFRHGSDEQADEDDEAADTLEARYEEIKEKIPDEAQKEIKKELNRMRHAHPSEASVAQDHAELLLDLPWGVYTKDPPDLRSVKDILNEDHAELEKVKERILEYLAVRQLNPAAKSRTLCLVGPPGVGKTSLGESIARALGRKFINMSLGGMHDEAELRGHRKTYIGAGPGLILEHMRRAGSANPVFMLDEGDKIGKDFRGDPSAALLSILDPKQNVKFFDWFAKVHFDLSRVLFVVTANIVETILPALLDRFEILEIPGYTPRQKLNIAKRHLIDRRKKEDGFPIKKDGEEPIDVVFTDEALLAMVDYVDEAGVRGFEDIIDTPFRKIAKMVQSGDETIRGVLEITKANVERYCGKPRKIEHTIPDILPPGVVPVLAVSDTGGHVFQAEVTMGYHPSDRKLKMTGVRDASQTKDIVNKIDESFQDGFDALMWVMKIIFDDVRAYEKEYGPLLLTGRLTDGAVPKDGPSAGVPLVGTIYGIVTKQTIKPTKETPLLGATGEITKNMLLVRAVGGIRDKILAAHRFGVRCMIIPKENERDIADIPLEIREDMDIRLVRTIPEALRIMYPNDERIRTYIESQHQ